MRESETIIVGGGPAGSSCAWELRKRGRDCLILERQALPKTKLCAGWIPPEVLRELEIEPASYPHGLVEMKLIRVCLGLSRLSLSRATTQYSIRRVEFDNWLLRRCGAEVVRHAVRAVARDGEDYVLDGLFRCRYLVGAGGTQCPVKRAFFGPDRGSLILTQEVEYPAAPKDAACTLFYPLGGLAGYGWCVPKAGALNVGYGGVAAQFKDNIKSLWDGFARALLKHGLISTLPPSPSSHPYYVGDRRKRVRAGGAFIVGDAAGLATCDIGEGIRAAVQSGLAAAREIAGAGVYDLDAIPRRTLDNLPGKVLSHLVAALSQGGLQRREGFPSRS